jgi:hypothetical protein
MEFNHLCYFYIGVCLLLILTTLGCRTENAQENFQSEGVWQRTKDAVGKAAENARAMIARNGK